MFHGIENTLYLVVLLFFKALTVGKRVLRISQKKLCNKLRRMYHLALKFILVLNQNELACVEHYIRAKSQYVFDIQLGFYKLNKTCIFQLTM